MPLLTLAGHPLPEPATFVRPATLAGAPLQGGSRALDLDATADVAALAPHLPDILLIRIAFAGFADGRGFSLARQLRQLGYRGRLRAAGPLIPDQRGALLGSGFDEVELEPAHLDRLGGPAVWAAEVPQTPYRRRRRRAPTPRDAAA